MRYEISAQEVLEILGYEPQPIDTWLDNMHLPESYHAFLERAKDCPLFQTACLCTASKCQTLYESIGAEIEDWKQTWADKPETREGELYEFSCLPVTRWEEKTENFLLIGSEDGVVQFGIRMTDLGETDPVLYWNHEQAGRTQWNADRKLSEFLLEVLWSVLCCVEYDTAEQVLEEQGWKMEEYFDETMDDWVATEDTLIQYGIDVKALTMHPYQDGAVFGCYDADRNIIYTGYQQEEEISLYAISRADTEDIFPEY